MKSFQIYLIKKKDIERKYRKKAQEILKKISTLENLLSDIRYEEELIEQYNKLSIINKKEEKEIKKYNKLIRKADNRANNARI